MKNSHIIEIKSFINKLAQYNCKLFAQWKQYEEAYANQPKTKHTALCENAINTYRIKDSEWKTEWKIFKHDDKDTIFNVICNFTLLKGELKESTAGIVLEFDNWSENNYVLLPGAAYNGNRFESRRIKYSPKLTEPVDIGKEKPMIISDVPRLNIHAGYSRIQERSGSMSVPAIGFQSPESNQGFWLLFTQKNTFGDYGISIEENNKRNQARITLTSPLVRETYKYKIADNQYPTNDKPANFVQGDTIQFTLSLHFFQAPAIQFLFNQYVNIRNYKVKPTPAKLPFTLSDCFQVIENKFNHSNFIEKHGYYAVGMRNGKYPFLQDWQIGWTGGMISTYPLLIDGNSISKQRVIQNFDWLFNGGISPSGLFWDAGEQGTIWYGGDPRWPHTKNWHLIRKSGDALFYIVKQFMVMQHQNITLKNKWINRTKRVADVLIEIWNKNRQFGQFVDSYSAEIIVGGSTSGAIIPAALCVAGSFFNNLAYIETAKQAMCYFYDNYIQKGISCGGPGDALQNPDSESSYALLESLMTLYEFTGEAVWLQHAQEMANQFSTWVFGYNYKFPEHSMLHKIGIQSTGAVAANTQNKHSAPGICTHSGAALLRLYRATGNEFYIKLLQEIVQHIPQNLSHPGRPIEGMETGWITERISTTDWFEGIGEIMYGSTWAETALMLTFSEIPGIYVQTNPAKVFCFDKCEVTLNEIQSNVQVVIKNVLDKTIQIKLMVDDKDKKKQRFDVIPVNYKKITLKSKEEKIVTIEKK